MRLHLQSRPRQPPDRGRPTLSRSPPRARVPKAKRIVMNPPQSFMESAAAFEAAQGLGGLGPAVNNPIVIGQGGQAAMVAPAATASVTNVRDTASAASPTSVPTSTDAATTEVQGQVVISGSSLEVATSALPGVTATSASVTSASATIVSAMTTTQTPVPSTTAASTDSIVTTTAAMTSLATVIITSTASPTPGFLSSTLQSVSSMSSSTVTPPPPTSTRSIPSTTLTHAASSGTASSSSAMTTTSNSSAAANPSSTTHKFTHSAPFIFLMLLSCLVVVAVIATSLSWVVRWRTSPRRFFLCCGRGHDDDDADEGLSNLVESFHQPASRSSSIHRSTSRLSAYDDADADPEKQLQQLQRRSSMFAHDPTQSPFLHSGSVMSGQVFTHPQSGVNAPSIALPLPAHLFGATGPLEVRNAQPGEIFEDAGREECGTPRETFAGSTPRHLGVEGNGLDVPWSRQSSIIGLGIEPLRHSTLSSPYLSPPDARDYFGPPFPSPPVTIDEEVHPQRAGTWASNLRTTLFAAISGVASRPGNLAQPEYEDKFTRQVSPLHRNSTRRSRQDSVEDGTYGPASAFPIVIEEKDEYHLPESDAEVIGSVFLAPSMSASSSRSEVGPIRRMKRSVRIPVGDRYKRYARSQRSGGSSFGEDSSTDTSSEWSSTDARGPGRLAGGERALGAKRGMANLR